MALYMYKLHACLMLDQIIRTPHGIHSERTIIYKKKAHVPKLTIMYQSRGPYQIYKAPRAVRPEGFRNLICPRGWYIIVLEYPFKSTSKVLNFVIDLIFKINKLFMT